MTRRAPHAGGAVLQVEVGMALLQGGLAFIIDTPGVGGLGQPTCRRHRAGPVPSWPEFTEPETWFVRQAHQIRPVGAVVIPRRPNIRAGGRSSIPMQLKRR